MRLEHMIITRNKPFTEIIASLNGYTRIFLVGCGECSTTCKTGGEQELLRMKEALQAQGKEVVGMCLPKAPCVMSQVKVELAKHTPLLRKAEAVLVMACGLGVQAARQSDRMKHDILPALDTVCGAVVETAGDFDERCSLCGACVLGDTAGYCPVTLCAKGLLNGPCGGMDKGKCEVDKDRDCVWVLIHKELKARKKGAGLKNIRQPRDYQKSTRPHRVRLS
ncbi:MAG: methylenetetrahydrofolate reductase C-terminal domain-containing protein [Candidatus Omnitrophica bacterium]|nr:methylenetetrahydrofolate reductase C-terminal domain-containing protein [Candidatus Omnitrophota bacterium]